MRKRKLSRSTVAIILFNVLAALLLGALLILRNDVKFAAAVSQGFARQWIAFVGKLTSKTSVSLYEITLYLAGIGIVAFIVTVVIWAMRKRLRAVLRLTAIVTGGIMLICSLYICVAGVSYHRDDHPLPVEELYGEEVYDMAQYYVEDFVAVVNELNTSEGIKCPYSFDTLSRIISEEYSIVDGEYYSSFTPRAKRIRSSRIMSEMHILGVFFAPYGEIGVNGAAPMMEIPMTIAHEIAHAKGVMRESEADLTAEYVLLSSQHAYLRYSAYDKVIHQVFNAMSYDLRWINSRISMSEGSEREQLETTLAARRKRYEEIKALYATVEEAYAEDCRESFEFWDKYRMLSDVTEFFNDLYLKLQGVEQGTGSYRDEGKTENVPVVGVTGTIHYEYTFTYSGVQKLLMAMYRESAS